MPIADNGPEPNAFDIEPETKANDTYRTVAWAGQRLQVTLMSMVAGATD